LFWKLTTSNRVFPGHLMYWGKHIEATTGYQFKILLLI